MTEGPSVLPLGGGQVLLRGLAVADAARLVEAAVDLMQRRDGIVPPARLVVLRRVLRAEAAAVSGRGPADVRFPVGVAESDRAASLLLGTAAAATVLEVSPRHVRRLAVLLGGRRLGGRWAFDSDTVAAVAAQRQVGREDSAA